MAGRSTDTARRVAYEYGFTQLTPMRECPLPDALADCDQPEKAADYFRMHVTTHPYYNPDVESLVVLMLNTRRRPLGHVLVGLGTLDTILVHPREVFRPAIARAAQAVVLMHNHPSGDPTPSEADIKVTRDLYRAGQYIMIEVLDHVILGRHCFKSLKALGYFY